VEWYFRDISNDPSEKELTQQDQFNNDEVILAEALVRETIQNSTDARRSDDDPVRVRFTLGEPQSPAAHSFFVNLLDWPYAAPEGVWDPQGENRPLPSLTGKPSRLIPYFMVRRLHQIRMRKSRQHLASPKHRWLN
jgi:hypothetical protein